MFSFYAKTNKYRPLKLTNKINPVPQIKRKHQKKTMIENLDQPDLGSQICRICLTTNVKMFSLLKYDFFKKYQDVTGLQYCHEDNFPAFLCWECAHRLSSCHRFKSRAVLSHCLLTGLLDTDQYITQQNIRKIDRFKNGLESKLMKYKSAPDYYDLKLDDEQSNEKISNEAQTSNKAELIESKNVDDDDLIEEEIKLESDNVKVENSDDGFNDNGSYTSEDEKIIVYKKNANARPKRKTTKPTESKTKPIKSKMSKTTAKVKPKTQAKAKSNDATSENKPVRKRKTLSEYLDTSLFEISDLTLEEQIREIEKRKDTDNYVNSDFRCEKCFKGFLDEAAFKFHSIRHTNQSGEYECPVCKIHFKKSQAMKNHSVSHRQKFTCKHCVFITTRRHAAKLHADFHNGTKYNCPHCQEDFSKISTYLSHIRIKHPSDIVCEVCGYSFISIKGLDLHKKLKHRFDEEVRPDNDYSCEQCQLTFLNATALETHLKVSLKHAGNSEDSSAKKRNSADRWTSRKDRKRTEPIRRKPRQPIQCEQCDAQLPDAVSYYQHFRRAHPGKNRTSYPALRSKCMCMCEVCGRMFQTLALLQDHRYVHATERQFKCEYCEKSFQRKYALIAHLRVHTGKKPVHSCSVCGRGFTSTSNLRRHMPIHTGVKPFECEVCGKCFKNASERRLHVTYVHLKKPWPKRNRAKRTPIQDPSHESEASSTNTEIQPMWAVCDDPKAMMNVKTTYML